MLVALSCAHGKGACIQGEAACVCGQRYHSAHAYRRNHGRQTIARLCRAYKWAERTAKRLAKKCEAGHGS